jgi:cysteinyl-tRNA synthetase
VKLVPPAELLKARDEKRAAAEAKAVKKAEALAAERAKREAKLLKGAIPPSELFRPPNVPEGAYSSWDERGLPTADGDGKELSKNAVKKAAKEWDNQEKLHGEYLKSKASGS